MATKTDKPTYEDRAKDYLVSFQKDYKEDWDIHQNYINTFDPYESMLIGQTYDSVTASVGNSKVTDSYAATLVKERADRVIAKTPDGETESVGKADVGKAAFMDILRQKWIYPNANAQHPFLEKLNMWQLYSSVYGYMPMFYDWNVSPTGYVGPDCWLWNPRNLVPQQGRTSIADMDYVTALAWVGYKQLEDIKDSKNADVKDSATGKAEDKTEEEDVDDGWNRNALQLLCEKAKDELTDPDQQKDSVVTRNRTPQAVKKGICLATRYEAGEDGEWITFAPEHGYIEVRRLKNPHKNGRIPFVIKYSQPLFDSFYGLGDFQLDMGLQAARDGARNLYFATLKRNLAPGIIVNANGVVHHTLDVTSPNPILQETIKDSIRPMPTNTAGLSTYQAIMSDLTGALLARNGSQNASIPGSDALNPSQGKTPQAIEMYNEKEATRDGADRRHLETAIEELTDGFFSMVANIGTEDIPIALFSQDIQDIYKSGLTDIKDLFTNFKQNEDGSAGVLTINPEKLKGVEYKFNISTNSTMKLNKAKQLAELERFAGNIGKFQNIFKDDPRVDIHLDKIASAFGALSDIKGADEFVTITPGPSPQEIELQQKAQELEQKNVELEQNMLQMQQAQEAAAAQPQVSQPVGGNQFADPDLAGIATEFLSNPQQGVAA